MVRDPLISVVIPTRNRAHMIQRALESLQSQTIRDFEVLVVDDGGIDETVAVVSDLKDARFHYVRTNPQGAAQARNFGLQLAKGEFVSFLDSDDEVTSDWLETLLIPFSDPSIAVSMCSYTTEPDQASEPEAGKEVCADSGLYHLDSLLGGIFLARRLILISVGGYSNLPAMQQKDLGRKLRHYCEQHSLNCSRTNRMLMIWHQHDEDRVSQNSQARYRSLITLLDPMYEFSHTITQNALTKYLYEASAHAQKYGTFREELDFVVRSLKAKPMSIKRIARLVLALTVGPFRSRELPASS